MPSQPLLSGEPEAIFASSELTIEAFDFSLLPSLNRELTLSLFEEDFLEMGENAIIFGGPGTGKTHLLWALGRTTALRGKTVRLLNFDTMGPQSDADRLLEPLDMSSIGLQCSMPEAQLRADLLHCDLLLLNEFPRTGGRSSFWLVKLLESRFQNKRSTVIVSRVSPRDLIRNAVLDDGTSSGSSFSMTPDAGSPFFLPPPTRVEQKHANTFSALGRLHIGLFCSSSAEEWEHIRREIADSPSSVEATTCDYLSLYPVDQVKRGLLQDLFRISPDCFLRPWRLLAIREDSLRNHPRFAVRRTDAA